MILIGEDSRAHEWSLKFALISQVFLRLAHAWNLVKFLYCATVMHGDKYILLYVQCKLIEAGHFIGGISSLYETDWSDEDLKLVRMQYN